MIIKCPLHGWLIVNKPAGPSSAQVVGRVKYLLKPQKIGHGGTLDPMATGVLPLALGEATKTMPFILDSDKEYDFTLVFGTQTATDDAAGEVMATHAHRPTREDIEAVLPQFRGLISQLPPAVSALKVNGERAYKLARAGEIPDLKPRPVTVHRLECHGLEGATARLSAHVSKGTYIRSLARDIAAALGTLGHVGTLHRTRHGPFTLAQAVTPEMLDKSLQSGEKPPILPLDVALHGLVAHHVTAEQELALRHGKPLLATGWEAGLARLYAAGSGQLLAVVDVDATGAATVRRGFNPV
ncbi:MAG: tRNA pseudouridine(55) synthase TruB [Pseudomonadaceae bacterium]|nr:tRNA pseudouridine(55) synthase TruB [Pseudomonadaceae bacterium]